MRRSRFGKFLALFIIFAPIAVFLFGTLVKWLWNDVLVPVLHISPVTFWQAVGILVLAKILFGSFSGGSRRDYRKERMLWNNMTPEQKEKFREEWKNRRSRWGRGSWDTENPTTPLNPET
jgi:Ca2+/H+ antiporter, TMEM165/GDT1 family